MLLVYWYYDIKCLFRLYKIYFQLIISFVKFKFVKIQKSNEQSIGVGGSEGWEAPT